MSVLKHPHVAHAAGDRIGGEQTNTGQIGCATRCCFFGLLRADLPITLGDAGIERYKLFA